MTIEWPMAVLRPTMVSFDIAPRTLAGASSVNGAYQVISSSAGIWTATLGSVRISKRAEILTFRAISARLEGRLNPIMIPLCRAWQPVPDGAVAAGLYDAIPHADGTYFSDASGYSQRVIDVQLSASVAKGGTSASIAINNAGTIYPGQHFSIADRLYRLKTVDYTAADAANITFSPPARESATTGDYLDFDNPVCRMRLADDKEMDLPLDGRRFSNPTVNFIEDL